MVAPPKSRATQMSRESAPIGTPSRDMAVAVGFEPTVRLPPHALSRRAPLAARTRHRRRGYTPPFPSIHPRWRAKNSRTSCPHSASITPPITSGRCASRRSRKRSQAEPAAPYASFQAPNTTREMRANWIAPAHIGHGSSVTAMVQPSNRHVPTVSAARRSARTSACAVGSPLASRSLTACAMIRPSESSTTAPTGTSSSGVVTVRARSRARRTASRSESRCTGWDYRLFARTTAAS